MPNEVCEGNFGGTFFRHRDSGTGGSREPPVPVKGVQAILAFAQFVWHFIVGEPWDSITPIAKKTLFGVHAQVSCFIANRAMR